MGCLGFCMELMGNTGNRIASGAMDVFRRCGNVPTWREVSEILTRFPFTYRDRFFCNHFPSFFSPFLRVVSGHFLVWFGSHFGTLLASIFPHFFTLKSCRFFDVFWGGFWIDFGGPDPRKWSSRLSETLILTKSPFSSQGGFLMQNGPQNGAKMEPKGHSKSMKKVMHFLIEKCIDFWWKMEPLGTPKGPQNPGISGSFRASSPGPPQRRKMDSKWPQNGAKVESKWSENGVKMELKSKEN